MILYNLLYIINLGSLEKNHLFVFVSRISQSVGLTEKQHEGVEEGKGEEHLSVADKRVVWVVLRIHLSCERHAGDDVHGEAAEAPARQR